MPITILVSKKYGMSSLPSHSSKYARHWPNADSQLSISRVKLLYLAVVRRLRLALCKLINRETNLLVLDEPTNHLDVDAKDELKRALKAYKGSILLISHEPEFYRDVVTETWNCESWTTKVF